MYVVIREKLDSEIEVVVNCCDRVYVECSLPLPEFGLACSLWLHDIVLHVLPWMGSLFLMDGAGEDRRVALWQDLLHKSLFFMDGAGEDRVVLEPHSVCSLAAKKRIVYLETTDYHLCQLQMESAALEDEHSTLHWLKDSIANLG